MKRTFHSAFTLVEVMIVISIIAILASFAVPSYLSYRKTAHAQACVRNMEQVKIACRTYLMNHGTPTTDISVMQKPGGLLSETSTCCPIGGTYTIEFDATKQDFTVSCSMADEGDHNVTEQR